MTVQSQDIASLFKELEDASKLAKLEEKDNKKKTETQVKELDSFLTSVQKVVKVIEKKDDDTPIKPKKVTPKIEKKSKPNGKVQEQSKPVEKKSLSKDDTQKLDAFSGLIKSFGVEIKPEIVEEDLQLKVEDIKPVIVEEPKVDESKKIEALETLFSGLSALKPEPKIEESLLKIEKKPEPVKIPEPLVIETKTPEPVKPVVVSQTPVDITEAMKLVKSKNLPTKQETIEATQKLITDVVDNLDDMKDKTEVKEQIDEIDALRKEFHALQLQVRRSEIQVGGLSGSGGGLDPNKIANHMIPAADNTFDLGSANKQWRNLYLSGSTLIVDGSSIDSGELTVLDGVTAGTVTASKALIADSNKDISGFRNVTIAGNLTVQGDTTTLSSTVETETPSQIYEASTITVLVTVATKDTSHPYYGTGSSNGYKINGTFSPFLKFIPLNTYKFDQSDSTNSGHPLRFYYDAAKTTEYTSGVTTSGTPGSSGAYTQIVPTESTPDVLYYQCSSHAHMGFGIFFTTRNLTGFTTDNLTEGSTNKYASAETVQDIVGGMFSNNTETRITATYQDDDGTVDLVVDDVTTISGNAGTATALETARNIGGISFDGTGNINLPGVNIAGDQDTTGNAATATSAARLTNARNIHGVAFDGSANIDLSEVIQDTVGAMFTSNTETGISVEYQDLDGTIDLVVGTLNQDTTGNAATADLATAANTVKTVADGTDANFFLTFVDANNGSATAEALKTDAGIQYNPNTDTLSVTNITATIDGVSSLLNVADESTDPTCFPLFTTGASGNLAAKSGTNLTFNSSTGALKATSFVDGNDNALTTATAAADEATALGIALG
jgi:hypothetical protein